MNPRTHVLLLTLRGRRLHTFAAGCLMTAAVALVLPASVPVLYRDVSADPWQLVWSLPACFVVACTDPALDHMETVLFRRPWRRRATVLGGTIAISSATTLAGGLIADRSPWGPLCALCILLALVLVLVVLSSQSAAAVSGFVILLTHWVFGIDELTTQARPWAVLLRPADPGQAGIAWLSLAAAGGLWTVYGSRSHRT